MSGSDPVSRRQFLQGGGAAIGSSALRLSGPAALAAVQAACSARDEGRAFTTLTTSEAREIEAFSARILPTTTTPGAREAGVVYFFDNVLGGSMASMLGPLRGGLEAFQAGIAERFSGAGTFSDLYEVDQDAWITEQQDSPFVGLARALTLMGFFAMSRHGGNVDEISWDLIDFAGHTPSQPPYGYYDAQYAEEKRDGN